MSWTPEEWLLFAAAVAAVASAVFAGLGLWQNARQSRLLTTMAHLRVVTEKLHLVRSWDQEHCERAVLSFYAGELNELAPAGKDMLALLDELDLTVVGIEEGAVDGDVSLRWLKTIFGEEKTVRRSFLKEFQECCADPQIYEQLERLIKSRE